MPFFKANERLIYYAHVPKCGGSSIARYLQERFGQIAFYNTKYLEPPLEQRWTNSSPQHVDAASLEALIPLGFFDGIFAAVRHPVSRLVSTYHFQLEVEKIIPVETSFSNWLDQLDVQQKSAAFPYDNHLRPMTDIVPNGASVFHMEHGLDGLILWLDQVSGDTQGPRAIMSENKRGTYVKASTPRVTPSPSDIDTIAELFAADFKRFGYDPHQGAPSAPKPVLDAAFLSARTRDLAASQKPIARLRRKIRRRLQR